MCYSNCCIPQFESFNKILWHSVPYAENFYVFFLFSGICWSFVFGVHCLRHHNLPSYSCFQTNVLAKFVDTICIFFYSTHTLLYFICHCTEYKLSALQVRISDKNTQNTMTQQFITAKISGCVLKQGSKTHSSLCQSNSQPGPSLGFHSRGGAEITRGATCFNYNIWWMQQLVGQTWNGEHRFQMGGPGTIVPPAGDGPVCNCKIRLC